MKVLIATDGSRYAARAVDFLGVRLRKDATIDLDVAAVTEPTEDDRPLEEGGAWIERDSRVLRERGHRAGTVRLSGDPAMSLVRASADYDLVVAGVKGRAAAPFFELGTVAQALLRDADSAVLLVRGRRKTGPRSTLSRPLDDAFRVLLSTRGAERELAAAWELLGPFADPDVEVATVMEPRLTASAAGDPRPPWSGAPRTEVRSQARRWLQHAVGGLPAASPAARHVVLEGRPAPEIGRRAQEVGAEMIVVGYGRNGRAHGSRGGPGSTARELAWSAPCSVLLVRDE